MSFMKIKRNTFLSVPRIIVSLSTLIYTENHITDLNFSWLLKKSGVKLYTWLHIFLLHYWLFTLISSLIFSCFNVAIF